MMVDYANEIKQMVPMRELCDRYGIRVNRAHKALCPFHPDRSPSMEVFDGTRGWWCFVCNEGGDVIDFTMRFFRLPFRDAMARLNEDFALHLPLDAPMDDQAKKEIARRKQLADTERRFNAWREDTIRQLSACFRLAHMALKSGAPNNWTQSMCAAVVNQAMVGAYLDILDGSDLNEQMQIFRQRREVRDLCDTILKNMPRRSKTA